MTATPLISPKDRFVKRLVGITGFFLLVCSIPLLLTPEPVLAYGGPGSIITGFGALLAVLAAVFAGIFGFVWFPLKRLARKIKILRGPPTPGPTAKALGESQDL